MDASRPAAPRLPRGSLPTISLVAISLVAISTPLGGGAAAQTAQDQTVSCGGQAALYEDGRGFSVFVARRGAVVVENPLRPLTPETTQVLGVVIGAKAATAYGPDLSALRRGGAPTTLEAMLGGAIRWEPALDGLPASLAIVSEAGEPLARLDYRRCAPAPAIAAAPAARPRKPRAGRHRTEGAAGAPAPAGRDPVRTTIR